MFRAFAAAILFACSVIPVVSQANASAATSSAVPAAPPAFEAVDVRESPHVSFARFMEGGRLIGDRYSIRQATMPQLIAAGYDFDSANVVKGPSWLDMDHFDIAAKAPPGTPPATLKLMMRTVLKDRFNLVVHEGSAPLPAYVLSLAKGGKPSMKESEGSSDARCEGRPSDPNAAPGAVVQILLTCHNETMDAFAKFLQAVQGAGYLNKPVVDSTGLKVAYDFDLKWTPQQLLEKAGDEGISLFDALEKQLGLKLALETAPRPVLIVDSVNEAPTPNLPGIEKILPPPPMAQFDVATIKPSKPDTRQSGGIRGGQVNVQGFSLKQLIDIAWDINPIDNEGLVGSPAWLDKDKFDILAKVASDDAPGGPSKAPQIDFEELKQLLRWLIAERFKMQSHIEERPVTAYTLVAAEPKIKPAADPTSRMNCTEGTGPDGRDPRKKNPNLNRLLWCQNMTMAMFASQLQYLANGFIYYPVVDGTGLKGGWDFALNFSSIQLMAPSSGGGSGAGGGGGGGGASGGASGGATPSASSALAAPDPNGAMSLFDAVRSQLGLKLEKVKRSEPVLVIDHLEEQPTEN